MKQVQHEQLTDIQRKWLRIAFVLVIGFLVVWVIGVQISRIGRVAVEVKFAPFDAVVELDGVRVRNGSVNWMREGKYIVTVEREGFERVEREIEVAEEQQILGMMVAVDDIGRNITLRRSRDFMMVESLAGGLARETGRREREDWPILRHLPVRNMLFSIGSEIDEDGELVVVVRLGSGAFQEAAVRELLRIEREDEDVDLIDYNIRFEGGENPFRRNGSSIGGTE
ncbi:PEGA domain-containing protein [Candidatus Saccharibacteria bacterium]|nr:PEGA domain-containing protein [Candidatus Saccharibacteria bacterium]